MKLLSSSMGKDWVSPDLPAEIGTKIDPTFSSQIERIRKNIDKHLSELLLSNNLIVLCGLGVTLHLTNHAGTTVSPSMSKLWEKAKEKAGNKFADICGKVKYAVPLDGGNIEVLLSHCQLSQTLQHDSDVANFISETEDSIVRECRFINDDVKLDIYESFLRKVARRSTRLPRAKIFTTNYDLCFETAASHTRFAVVDGFSHTQPQEFDGTHFNYDFVRRIEGQDVPDYIPNVFHLYKMHGSVDWELKGSQIIKTPSPARPIIIYPRHSKFESSFDQPFIEMMSRFQACLRQSNTGLLAIGVGFNDSHITQPIMSAIRSNVSLKAMIVSPGLESTTKSELQSIISLVRGGDTRLSLLSTTFEEMVPILPDLIAITEEEKHLDRLREFK